MPAGYHHFPGIWQWRTQYRQTRARKLGVPYYDTAILNMTRKEHPQTFEAWRKEKDNHLSPLLAKVYDDYVHYSTGYESKRQEMFNDESDVIRELTNGKSCVIVGRLANYILRKRPNTFNVFISSDPDWAVQRIMLREHVDADTAMKSATGSIKNGGITACIAPIRTGVMGPIMI